MWSVESSQIVLFYLAELDDHYQYLSLKYILKKWAIKRNKKQR